MYSSLNMNISRYKYLVAGGAANLGGRLLSYHLGKQCFLLCVWNPSMYIQNGVTKLPAA